ncbi:hypothetical protein DWB68_07160 [Galactobacter valiniphilus]|uniref:Type I restriction modification DNA specificity domain-containing protein n=1 Tax=Galactobacter valiniphilus TaxID=2676122 RepID=A0A399JEA8_9MICC|nr:hypothetical protein DWB68_07160 [Galactobacter valiniphilus]
MPAPARWEQSRIADFLDRETAEIDAFVAERGALALLAQERFDAARTELVWGGVNARASLRRYIHSVEQGHSPEADSTPAGPGETGVLKAGCTNHGVFDIKANKRVLEESEFSPQEFVRTGDLIVTRASGSLRHVGSAALVPDLDRHLAMSDKHYRLNLTSGYDKRFVSFVMQTRLWRAAIEPMISGAQGLARNISIAALKGGQVPVLDLGEQQQRAERISLLSSEHEALQADLSQALALAQERRAALISAAVTGQIDVTGRRKPAVEQLQDEIEEAR